jgi:hypothetical protein
MRPKKKNTLPRGKPPFGRALDSAKALLASKIAKREKAIATLQHLNIDIPNLERTIRALEAQLGEKGVMPNATGRTTETSIQSTRSVLTGDHRAETSDSSPILDVEIPPEIRAQLPPEDFSKFGSHYAKEEPGTEEFLPPIDGKPVIPEGKK